MGWSRSLEEALGNRSLADGAIHGEEDADGGGPIEGSLLPAGEEVLQVPLALAVADEDETTRHFRLPFQGIRLEGVVARSRRKVAEVQLETVQRGRRTVQCGR